MTSAIRHPVDKDTATDVVYAPGLAHIYVFVHACKPVHGCTHTHTHTRTHTDAHKYAVNFPYIKVISLLP